MSSWDSNNQAWDRDMSTNPDPQEHALRRFKTSKTDMDLQGSSRVFDRFCPRVRINLLLVKTYLVSTLSKRVHVYIPISN